MDIKFIDSLIFFSLNLKQFVLHQSFVSSLLWFACYIEH